MTAALDDARSRGLTLPVVYNTGGYETPGTIRTLEPYVDIWLTDYKYASPALAAELSRAKDYPAVADDALRLMLRQTGAPVFGEDGFLRRGVIRAASGPARPCWRTASRCCGGWLRSAGKPVFPS